MNKAEFVRRLRKQYWPHVKAPKDGLGGYLVPEVVLVDRMGWKARFYRWLGVLFKNMVLYKKGTIEFNYKVALIEAAEGDPKCK